MTRIRVPLIEFLKDRIYLGAFDSPPNDTSQAVHFTIDDSLPYNPFHHDFGPLHIGHLYRFAVTLHEILGEESNEGKAVVLYSRTNPRDRANAACVLCCYMVLIQSWPPHLALTPIAQADPPFTPFRDAGYAPADFGISIQDVVYGVWRAKEQKLIDIRGFNLEEYELYERVDQGDFNEIGPNFVAFASPQQSDYEIARGEINYPFQQVLNYFETHSVKLVVRLNSHLYDKGEFENRGIKHVDMVFEDGTCPTMEFVKAFIGAVEGVIAEKGKVAVHCKAGLGRTGCLIGAHLIYTHGFTAQECIAYMRFLRPGMVVGPQQHWLYLHQNEFRDWRRTMTISTTASEKLAGYCPLVPRTFQQRSPNSKVPRTPERRVLGGINGNAALPVPTPGQPRKNSPSPAGRKQNLARSPVAKKYLAAATGQNSDDDAYADGDTTVESIETAVDETGIYKDTEEEEGYNSQSDEGVFGEAKPITRPKRSGAVSGGNQPESPLSPTGTNGVLKSRSRPASSAQHRKLSSSVDLFGDEENVDVSGSTLFDETSTTFAKPPSTAVGTTGKRSMTSDDLSQTQVLQLQRQRPKGHRVTSNPQPANGPLVHSGGTRKVSSNNHNKLRNSSYQTTTTTTTVTTLTTMLSSSPPTSMGAIKAVAGVAAVGGVESPVRRSARIHSNGVRKTSGKR